MWGGNAFVRRRLPRIEDDLLVPLQIHESDHLDDIKINALRNGGASFVGLSVTQLVNGLLIGYFLITRAILVFRSLRAFHLCG